MTPTVAMLAIMHHLGAFVIGVTILGHCHQHPPALAQRFQQGNKKARHFAMAGLIEIALPRQLAAVVHIKLYWMSGVLYTVNLFHFQLDIRVDHIVGKHTARCQELAISIE